MDSYQGFCCEYMKLYTQDKSDPVFYDAVLREYYIKRKNSYTILTLDFCPWCGCKLPTELRKEFFDILENEFGIETDIGEYKNDNSIPQEFRSDEWWKKRGL